MYKQNSSSMYSVHNLIHQDNTITILYIASHDEVITVLLSTTHFYTTLLKTKQFSQWNEIAA